MILRARGLHVTLGRTPVLRGVDVDVADGETVGLVGPNGSGKTTLLRALHRAVVPTRGTVELEGRDLAGFAPRERARRIAVMAQEEPGGTGFTVADTVLLGRLPHGGPFGARTARDRRIAEDALHRAGALHLAGLDVTTLSGGERQRVLAARALAQRPRVLLLDEPTNHLDIGAQHEVLEVVRRHAPTALVVLHDLNLAARYCDRVLVLAAGRVVAAGAPAEVLTPAVVGPLYGIGVSAREADDGVPQLLFRGVAATGPGPGDASSGTGVSADPPAPVPPTRVSGRRPRRDAGRRPPPPR